MTENKLIMIALFELSFSSQKHLRLSKIRPLMTKYVFLFIGKTLVLLDRVVPCPSLAAIDKLIYFHTLRLCSWTRRFGLLSLDSDGMPYKCIII